MMVRVCLAAVSFAIAGLAWETGTVAGEPQLKARVLDGHGGSVLAVAFSPKGDTLASGARDETVKLWNVRTGKLIRTLTGHTGRIESLEFSPDGRILATGGGGGDTSVRLWVLAGR